MARILVSVTQDDIDRGVAFVAEACPVALAIRRQTPFHQAVVYSYTWAPEGGHKKLLNNPTSVQRFIWRFDGNRMTARPFRFWLVLP